MASLRTYEHIGVNDLVLDEPDGKRRVSPGETFQAVLSPELETFFIQIEAIRPVPEPETLTVGEYVAPRKRK